MRRSTYFYIGGGVLALVALILLIGWLGFGWFKASAAPATPPPTPEVRVVEQTRIVVVEQTMTPAPAAPANPATSGDITGWKPAQKCEWLSVNVPQGNDGVDLQNFAATLLNVPTERVRVHIYPCPDATTKFDGFILLGPREGPWTSLVTVSVPTHGAVDSYNEATFSQTPIRIGQNTLRATSGQVTATTFTYWFWYDQDPPIDGSVSPTACQQPSDLVTSFGWTNQGMVDPTYGGLQVELVSTGTLPPLWEAVSSSKTIKETDTDRSMPAGVYTIYSPFSCREQLGYSK